MDDTSEESMSQPRQNTRVKMAEYDLKHKKHSKENEKLSKFDQILQEFSIKKETQPSPENNGLCHTRLTRKDTPRDSESSNSNHPNRHNKNNIQSVKKSDSESNSEEEEEGTDEADSESHKSANSSKSNKSEEAEDYEDRHKSSSSFLSKKKSTPKFDEPRLKYNPSLKCYEVHNLQGKIVSYPLSKYNCKEDCIKACLKHISSNYLNRLKKKVNKMILNEEIYGKIYLESQYDCVCFDSNSRSWKVDVPGQVAKTYNTQIFGLDRAKELAYNYYLYLHGKARLMDEFCDEATNASWRNVYYSHPNRCFIVRWKEQGKKKSKQFKFVSLGVDKAKQEAIEFAKSLGFHQLLDGEKNDNESDNGNENEEDEHLAKKRDATKKEESLPCPTENVRFYLSKGGWLARMSEHGNRKTKIFSYRKYGFYDSQLMALKVYFQSINVDKSESELNSIIITKNQMKEALIKKGTTDFNLD